jgi:REP element-mobilizing transposase RayT
MGSLSEYGRTAGAVHRLGYHVVWCPKYGRPVLVGHLRSRLPTLWSRPYFVASVGRVSEATIRRYIAEQSTRPTKGMP